MMKKMVVKLLVTVTAVSLMASSFCGCNTSGNDVGTGSEVLSEIGSEIDSSAVTNDSLATSEESTEEKVSEEASDTSEEATEESSETSEETSEETTETPTEETTEEPSEELPAYTVEDMSATMYAQKPVNVRSGPSTDYDKIGGLSKNQEVTVTGKASTGWYRISYNGIDGFVAASYLGNEKVVEPTTEQPPSEQPPSEQPPSDPPSGGENMEDGVFLYPALLDEINAFRRECGRTEVTWNSSKEAEAIARAEYVGLNRAINHDGMPADAMAEVVCCMNGHSDAEGMTAIWNAYMKSDGHRSSIAWELNTSCVVATYRYVSDFGLHQYYNVIIFY